jgi:hypothetical protein
MQPTILSQLPAPARDLLGGQAHAETLALGAFGAAILVEAHGDRT